ncbi:MAG: alpha/beta hydrolase [Candidatus Pelagibacter sp.]
MKIGSIVLNSFLILLIIYISVVVFLFFYQRKLLYHPSENNYLDETQLNHKIEKTYIQSNDKLVSWYFKKNSKFKTILFFHGNAGKLDNRVYKLNELSKLELNYLIVAYRGFSGNAGKPTESGLYEDANFAKIWLNKNGVKDEDIIIYGESLGTAVAIDLASRYNFSGIILESPFTSMLDLAQKYYPIFPVKLILKDRYESRKKLNDIKSPVLVMHGKKDKIVPFYMGEQILETLSTLKFSYFNDKDDHMMEYNKDLLTSIKKFLDQVN